MADVIYRVLPSIKILEAAKTGTEIGLLPGTLSKIAKLASQTSGLDSLVLFGSRALGRARLGSDLDLVAKGETLTRHDVSRLWLAIEDLDLPVNTDLLLYHKITSEELKDHIDRVGIELK